MKAELTENARYVLESRYLRRDPSGRVIEQPEDMFARVAKNVASAEAQYESGPAPEEIEQQFLEAMLCLDFLPNSPCLMNAGRRLQQLCACFVLDVQDSIDGIFDTLKHTAQIHQSGGGTGFSFSKLRPRGAYIATSGGAASGPVSFIRIFDQATEAINQGDIIEFIHCKAEEGSLVNFNISVGITDRFMEAVREEEPFDLVSPQDGKVAATVPGRQVFDTIVESAWSNGEPGLV
ncbi:MAG: ribonucleotide reductase N-terminal alpha domain-containing protein, partial [Planctomycetota bacterium]